jgi:hypothetical protein
MSAVEVSFRSGLRYLYIAYDSPGPADVMIHDSSRGPPRPHHYLTSTTHFRAPYQAKSSQSLTWNTHYWFMTLAYLANTGDTNCGAKILTSEMHHSSMSHQ